MIAAKQENKSDSILKKIGVLTLGSVSAILVYCLIQITSLSSKASELDGKIESSKIEAKAHVEEVRTKYEAERPLILQRIDSIDSRMDKLDNKFDGRFDRLEDKIDNLGKK